MSKFEEIKEIIGSECIDFRQLSDEDIELLGKFMNLASDAYVLVEWPDSQVFMDEDWFEEEAILDTEAKFGSSAYFIPLKRIINE